MFSPIYIYRIARRLWKSRIPYLPEFFTRVNSLVTGCEIPYRCEIDHSVRFMHNGKGVVLNHKVTIRSGVVIMPNVVIGQAAVSGRRHALERIVVEQDVLIGAGAVIIAKQKLVIGKSSTIGALTLVTKDIPEEALAVGNPMRIINNYKCNWGKDLSLPL